MAAATGHSPPRLGVSACLLGERVRYDGGHRRDEYLCGTLAAAFELVPLCPEAGAGLGVPRPPVHLVARADGLHAVGVEDPELDVTDALQRFNRDTLAQLSGLAGLVLKSGSPSCGRHRVPVRRPGRRTVQGAGLFAAAVAERDPALPVTDEADLGDPDRRDNFLERVFARVRWQADVGYRPSPAAVEAFHRRHALTLRSHDGHRDRALAERLDAARRRPDGAAATAYLERFMTLLARPATRARHRAVLRHLLARLRPALAPADREALEAAVAAYAAGEEALLVPLTLIAHHGRDTVAEWAGQVYLYPEPTERRLRCR